MPNLQESPQIQFNPSSEYGEEIRKSFAEHDLHTTITNFKVACVIGMLIMPAGCILDHFVYPAHALDFLRLRLACSGLIAMFLAILLTPFGQRNYRQFGVSLFMLPTSFLAWMIYATEGEVSPYYAGLNLVLLVLALVLHWSFWESLTATALVTILYFAVVIAHGITPEGLGIFVNNLYFLVMTGFITIIGSYFHSKTRFREFAYRYQLALSNREREFEANNNKLLEQNLALEEANRDIWKNISFSAAHKIGNPIFAIETDLAPLEKRIRELRSSEALEVVDNIRSSINKAKAFVEQFKSLTRAEEIRPVATPLLTLLTDASKSLENIDIDCCIECPEDLAVWADSDRLSECLDELISNAKHWFDKPEKQMEFKVVFPPPEPIPTFLKADTKYALLHVKDNGCGVPVANKQKIFNAFFTTYGQGAGLGLALVRRILDGHGGGILENGIPGHGADFEIYLRVFPQGKSKK